MGGLRMQKGLGLRVCGILGEAMPPQASMPSSCELLEEGEK